MDRGSNPGPAFCLRGGPLGASFTKEKMPPLRDPWVKDKTRYRGLRSEFGRLSDYSRFLVRVGGHLLFNDPRRRVPNTHSSGC